MAKRKSGKITPPPHLSVVVPVYNESARIHNIKNIHDFLRSQDYTWEILVVDDGSTDDTVAQLEIMQTDIPFRLLIQQPNAGKGAAVRDGMLAARGDWRLFTDVDLSTPMGQLDKFWEYTDHYPVVIGTRISAQADVQVHPSLLRQSLSKVFSWLSRTVLQTPISDFTCGFKLFSAEVTKQVFPKLTIERRGFDTELIFITHHSGFDIQEVPVTWINAARSKVTAADMLRSVHELFTIWNNNRRGLYE